MNRHRDDRPVFRSGFEPRAELRSAGVTRAASRNQIHRMRGVASVLMIGMVLVIVTLPSCVTPRRTFQPDVDPAQLDDVAFVHYLATVPTVTVAEGMRAVVLLLPPDERGDAERPREILTERGAFKEGWRLDSDATLDKGTLAFMLRTVCSLPRSLSETVWSGFGDRRFALHTCVDAGLLPYGASHEPVRGGELLSALTKAEEILAAAGVVGG